MLNFKSFAILGSLSILMTSNGYSQKESVILYNSQPVKVELSEKGNIKSFIGLVPGYMLGYDLGPKVSDSDLETTAKQKAIETQNAGYSIVSAERIELQYKPYFATLDKSIIDKLNDVSAKLKLNPEYKILLTANTLNGVESILSNNRLDSALAYLGLKGISQDRIQTETQQSDIGGNILSITYLY